MYTDVCVHEDWSASCKAGTVAVKQAHNVMAMLDAMSYGCSEHVYFLPAPQISTACHKNCLPKL